MKYYTLTPSPKLTPYVRFFWVLEYDQVSRRTPYIHRSMADGCCEFIFHYKGRFHDFAADDQLTPSFTAGVGGPSQKFARFQTDESFGIFGAYLYPYAVKALFGVPASAIVNQQVHLSDLLGQSGKDLEEQIALAANNHVRAQILNIFLESRLALHQKQQQPSVFAAIGYIIKNKGLVTVDALAQQHFLSMRQFERNFKDLAGFSPKLYTRIIRFQAAIEKYKSRPASLTELALECGYYDQSHFIHDFKEFSGYHPRTYFAGRNEGTAWKEAE